ncbi:MAG: hypothetical protein ACE5ES_03935, partial [Candidatus Nanoarchaeia archaeon]
MVAKKKVTLSIDPKTYKDFQKYCEDRAIMLSKKIELAMKEIMKSKGKKVIGFIFLFLFLIAFTYAAVFQDLTQGDFDNGTYINTLHNGSAVVLSGENLTGNFTSQIFDSTGLSSWDNISWGQGGSYSIELSNNGQGSLMEGNVLLSHMNNNFSDVSGLSNDLTALGDAAFSTSARLGSHAGSFDGIGDYVTRIYYS